MALNEYAVRVFSDDTIVLGDTASALFQAKLPLLQVDGGKMYKHTVVHIEAMHTGMSIVTDNPPSNAIQTVQLCCMDYPLSVLTDRVIAQNSVDILPTPDHKGVLYSEVEVANYGAAGSLIQTHSDTFPVEELGTSPTLSTYSDALYFGVLLTSTEDNLKTGVDVTFYVVVDKVEISLEEYLMGVMQHRINRAYDFFLLSNPELAYLSVSDIAAFNRGGFRPEIMVTGDVMNLYNLKNKGEEMLSRNAYSALYSQARTMVGPDDAFGVPGFAGVGDWLSLISVGLTMEIRNEFPPVIKNTNGSTQMN